MVSLHVETNLMKSKWANSWWNEVCFYQVLFCSQSTRLHILITASITRVLIISDSIRIWSVNSVLMHVTQFTFFKSVCNAYAKWVAPNGICMRTKTSSIFRSEKLFRCNPHVLSKLLDEIFKMFHFKPY